MDEKKAKELAQAVSDSCIARRVRFVNRVITNLYDRALRPLDVKTNQAGILVWLFLHGEAGPGDISKALRMEKSTVSRNVNRMKNKGWIEIVSSDDRPTQVIKVTEEGKKLLQATYVEWTKAQKKALELLGEDGVDSVRRLYETLSEDRNQK